MSVRGCRTVGIRYERLEKRSQANMGESAGSCCLMASNQVVRSAAERVF